MPLVSLEGNTLFDSWRDAECLGVIRSLYKGLQFFTLPLGITRMLGPPVQSSWPAIVFCGVNAGTHLALSNRYIQSKLLQLPRVLLDLAYALMLAIPWVVMASPVSSLPDHLVRHRIYSVSLSIALPTSSAQGFISRIGFFAFVLPCFICQWNLVHWNDPKAVQVVIFDILLGVAAIVLYIVFESRACQHFQALEGAKKCSDDAMSLEGCNKMLLDELFDASCFCDGNSVILSSSPGLDALLADGRPLSDSMGKITVSLRDYVSFDARLMKYLRRVERALTPHLEPLPMTLQSSAFPPQRVEVTAYGVSLSSALNAQSSSGTIVFLGFLCAEGPTKHKASLDITQFVSSVWQESSRDDAKQYAEVWLEHESLRIHMMFMACVASSSFLFAILGIANRLSNAMVIANTTTCGLASLHWRPWGARLKHTIHTITSQQLNRTVLQTILFGVLCFTIVEVSLNVADNITQHRCFLSMHILLAVTFGALTDMKISHYVIIILPLQFMSWFVFHRSVDFMKPAVVPLGVTICGLSSITKNVMLSKLRAVASALHDERLAQCKLQASMGVYRCMHRALLDVTCYVRAEGYVVASASASLDFHFGDFLCVPFVMVGKDLANKRIIHDLLADADRQEGICAVSDCAKLKDSQGSILHCRLVIVSMPDGASCCQEKCFFVGIRILSTVAETIREDVGVSSFDRSLLDASLQPGDSVSNVSSRSQRASTW